MDPAWGQVVDFSTSIAQESFNVSLQSLNKRLLKLSPVRQAFMSEKGSQSGT